MKIGKLILGFVFVFGLSMAMTSCGGHSHEGGDHSHGTEQTESHDHAGHDHSGHDHDGHSHAAAHGEGADYTSAYVCPMHCKGSGSAEQGKCPVCEMDLVAQADHVKDGHTH